MPCLLIDQLPLVWALSWPWHGPDRKVMVFCVTATQVVRLRKTTEHLISQTKAGGEYGV